MREQFVAAIVMLKVPEHMTVQEITRELETSIGFGRPNVRVIYQLPDPK